MVELEEENIILLVTFCLIICLVFVTGMIVCLCCRSNPRPGPRIPTTMENPATNQPTTSYLTLQALLLLLTAVLNKFAVVAKNAEETSEKRAKSEEQRQLNSHDAVLVVKADVENRHPNSVGTQDVGTMTTYLYEVSTV